MIAFWVGALCVLMLHAMPPLAHGGRRR